VLTYYGVLNDVEIARLALNRKMIEPFVGEKVKTNYSYGLEPHGYTFRLSGDVLYYAPKPEGWSGAPKFERLTFKDGDILAIEPQGIAICSSLEYFRLPTDVVGLLWGKSTFTRQGLCFNFAVVDAGFEGNLTFSVYNASPFPVELRVGEGIAQIVFLKAKRAVTPYSGKWQGKRGTAL